MIRRLLGMISGDHHDHVATLKAIRAPKNQPKPLPAEEIRRVLDA